MVARVSLLGLCLLAACDQLFNLDHVPPSGDASNGSGSDAPPGMLMTCLDDPFTVWPEPQIWAPYMDRHAINPDSMGLKITLQPSVDNTTHYAGIESVHRYDLTGGSIAFQAVAAPTGPASEAELIVMADSSNQYYMSIGASGTQLQATVNGTPTTGPTLTFTPGTYLRVRHDSMTQRVHFESGTDGQKYTSRWDVAATPVSAMMIAFNAGTYGIDDQPGVATFNHVKIIANACP